MTIKAIGVGVYLPGPKISSKQIAEKFKLNEEWISYFVGTKYRHFSIDFDTGEQLHSLADICTQAASHAIQNAGIHWSKIDAIVMASATPDNLMPATVNLVADRLGLNNVSTYQLQSGCAGAIQAMDLGMRLLMSGPENTVLIIGGDVCNKFMEFNQDFSKLNSKEIINYVLFGDGAGAVILQKNNPKKGIHLKQVINRFVGLRKQPGQLINWWGISLPENAQTIAEDYKAIEANVPCLAAELMAEILQSYQWSMEDIHYFLPPQLSKVMTDKIIDHIKIPKNKAINCIEMTGNNGNALPFIQLNEIFDRITPNENGVILAIESSKWIKAGVVFHG